MNEDPDALLERANRRYRTAFVCFGSVLLATVLTWVWIAIANRGVTAAMGCAPDKAGPGPLIVPEFVAVALVIATRRHAHRWYVTVALSVATFCLALVAVAFVAFASAPSACFS